MMKYLKESILILSILAVLNYSCIGQNFVSQDNYSDTLRMDLDNEFFSYSRGKNWPYFRSGQTTSGTINRISKKKFMLSTTIKPSQNSVLNFEGYYVDSLKNSTIVIFKDVNGKCLTNFNAVIIAKDGKSHYTNFENLAKTDKGCNLTVFGTDNPNLIYIQHIGHTFDSIYVQDPHQNYFEIMVSEDNSGPRFMVNELWIKKNQYFISRKYPQIRFKLLRSKSPQD